MDKLNGILLRNKISIQDYNRVSYECILLSIFVQLCNILDDVNKRKLLREKIRTGTRMGERYIYSNFIKDNLHLDLDDEELTYLSKLLEANLNKLPKRKNISEETRLNILKLNNNQCRYCGKKIEGKDEGHLDHIIPFYYVGDELGVDNLQLLCESCNKSKNASVIFLFKIFVERGILIYDELR